MSEVSLHKIPIHSWITLGALAGGLTINWALMNSDLQQHDRKIENIQDNMITSIQHDIRELREEIDDLQKLAATEDGADRLLEFRIEQIEKNAND